MHWEPPTIYTAWATVECWLLEAPRGGAVCSVCLWRHLILDMKDDPFTREQWIVSRTNLVVTCKYGIVSACLICKPYLRFSFLFHSEIWEYAIFRFPFTGKRALCQKTIISFAYCLNLQNWSHISPNCFSLYNYCKLCIKRWKLICQFVYSIVDKRGL